MAATARVSANPGKGSGPLPQSYPTTPSGYHIKDGNIHFMETKSSPEAVQAFIDQMQKKVDANTKTAEDFAPAKSAAEFANKGIQEKIDHAKSILDALGKKE